MKILLLAVAAAVFGLFTGGCEAPAKSGPSPRSTASSAPSDTTRWKSYQTGMASWYGGRWHGRRTANGERYNQNTLTAAHKKLPFNTLVRVTNLANGKSCIVRVNNRGPYVRGRVIDLSVAAAKALGYHSKGVAKVKLEVAR